MKLQRICKTYRNPQKKVRKNFASQDELRSCDARKSNIMLECINKPEDLINSTLARSYPKHFAQFGITIVQ